MKALYEKISIFATLVYIILIFTIYSVPFSIKFFVFNYELSLCLILCIISFTLAILIISELLLKNISEFSILIFFLYLFL